MKIKQKWIAVLLCGVMFCTMLTGCGTQAQALTSNTEVITVNNEEIQQTQTNILADVSYDMFRNAAAMQKEDVLISPLSAWLVLSMTGQGANGDTRDAFAQFSSNLSAEDQRILAAWLMEYLTQYADAEESGVRVGMANSVWCDDAFNVSESFVDTAQAYYRAQIIQQNLQAPDAVKNVNRWISDATDERIQDMLEQIDASAVMLLINALTLDAKWQSAFDSANTREDIFYLSNGAERTKEFMHKRLSNASYLKWDGGEGIVLPYQSDTNTMSMIALLPDENHSCDDISNLLSASWLRDVQENCIQATVNLSMPKFKMESSMDLSELCKVMGLEIAFDAQNADFSGIGEAANGSNLFIGRVLQDCMLEVGEEGTKAAAATVVEVRMTSARPDPSLLVNLSFNRPFVYLVIDNETQIPLFTGIYQGE